MDGVNDSNWIVDMKVRHNINTFINIKCQS